MLSPTRFGQSVSLRGASVNEGNKSPTAEQQTDPEYIQQQTAKLDEYLDKIERFLTLHHELTIAAGGSVVKRKSAQLDFVDISSKVGDGITLG